MVNVSIVKPVFSEPLFVEAYYVFEIDMLN